MDCFLWRNHMILYWMKPNSMMLVITLENFWRVTGEQHIHQINLGAGCPMFSLLHQVNSITQLTQLRGLVSICDVIHHLMQFYFAQIHLDRIYARCMVNKWDHAWVYSGPVVEKYFTGQNRHVKWPYTSYSGCLFEKRWCLIPNIQTLVHSIEKDVRWQDKMVHILLWSCSDGTNNGNGASDVLLLRKVHHLFIVNELSSRNRD